MVMTEDVKKSGEVAKLPFMKDVLFVSAESVACGEVA